LFVFLCTEVTDGLCYQLTKPCPKEPEVIPFKDLEINRNEIQTLKKLGAGQFGEVWAGKLTLFIPFLLLPILCFSKHLSAVGNLHHICSVN